MTDARFQSSGALATNAVVRFVERSSRLLARIPVSLTQLVLRFAVAIPFWNSGLTKWDGFLQISNSAVYLFQEEFKLHILGATASFPLPKLMAFLSGSGEILFPLMLFIGLGTRFAALGLLGMTAIIQLTIPDGWASFHLPWAAMALAVITYGPGLLSLDHLISRRFRR